MTIVQLPEIEAAAEAITVGRRVRFHGGLFGEDCDGLIVAVHGTPNPEPAQTTLGGARRVIRSNDCHVEVILFDGRRATVQQSSFGGIGIGYRLVDRVHCNALIQVARKTAAKREADELLAREKAKHDLADAQRSVVIKTAPVFFWNGIKDAKGEKLQKAHYSMGGYTNVPAEMAADTITIYSHEYTGFSALVRTCFEVKNESDSMTDYFEKDRIQVLPVHPLYPQVRAAFDAQQARRERRIASRD
jgi:hypothetical protein